MGKLVATETHHDKPTQKGLYINHGKKVVVK